MQAIRRLREKQGLTQQSLALQLGVTQGLISQWEIGETSPRADKLPLLAKILRCNIDELYRDIEAPQVS